MANAIRSPSRPEEWSLEDRTAAAAESEKVYHRYVSDEYVQAVYAIHNFKTGCEARNVDYADAFLSGDMTAGEYKKVDAARRHLMGFWRDVHMLYKNCKLIADDGDFFSPKKRWLRRGNEYRALVEPLDIANWYKASNHLKGSGHYFDTAKETEEDTKRPSQYAFLDRLMKDAGRDYVYSLSKAEEYKREAKSSGLQIQKLDDVRADPPQGFKGIDSIDETAVTREDPVGRRPEPSRRSALPDPPLPTMTNWPYDVFISCAGTIKELAFELENDLRGLGFKAFVDKSAMHPGDNADSKMVESATQAPVWLVLFNKDFFERKWPMAELKLIVEAGTLIPVLVGMSFTQFEEAWRASSMAASQFDEAFFQRVAPTFLVAGGSRERPLRERICFSVLRVFVENICPRLPDTARSMLHVTRFLSAARRIAKHQLPNLTRAEYDEAAQWVKHLESDRDRGARQHLFRQSGASLAEGGVLSPPGSSLHTSSDPPLALQEAAVRLMSAALSLKGHADLSGLSLGHLPLDDFEALPALVAGICSLDLSNTSLIDEGSYKGPEPLADTSYQGLVALAKLSNLHTLVLAGNHLTSLPAELGQLKNLRHLDLRNNQLTAVPESVRDMRALVRLLLDGHVGLKVIPNWLPARCPAIEELSLEACGFSALPFPVLRLPVLQKLRVGRNNPGMSLPSSLPADARSGRLYMGGLEELSLASLALVDENLSCLEPLKQLKRVDLRENRLVSVPHFLFEVDGLQSLELGGNDALVTPPREIVRHGLPAMKEYMRALAAGKTDQRNIVRVMFVGYAEAGKTKLNYALQGRMPDWKLGSTVGINTAKWAVDWAGPDSEDIEFRSWDFAGQKEYYAMHRIFLTDRAVYLFLVDLSTPQPGEGDFAQVLQETVRFWLDSLTRRTSRAFVRVVATKVDRLEAEVVTARLQVLLELLGEEQRFQSAKLAVKRPGVGAVEPGESLLLPTSINEILLSSLPQDPVANDVGKDDLVRSEVDEVPESLRFLGTWGPRDLAGVAGPSASSKGRETEQVRLLPEEDDGQPGGRIAEPEGKGALVSPEDYLSRIRNELVGLAKEESFQIQLPASYVQLMAAVEKKKFGTEAVPYMEWNAFRDEMLIPAGLVSEESAEVATTLLHELGIVLWFKPRQGSGDAPGPAELAQRVFLDPQWVIDLLKPILSHSDENQFLPPSGDPAEWGSHWAREYATNVGGAHQHRLKLIKLLKEKGTLHHELLDFIPNAQQAPGRTGTPRSSVQRNVLDLLERYRLAYPVKPYPTGYHFVPTRCKERPPSNLHPDLFPFSSKAGPVELGGMRLTFSPARKGRLPRLPEGFAESVIVDLHSLVMSIFHQKRGESAPGITEQWEHGCLFRGQYRGLRIAILVDVPSAKPNTLEILCSLRPVVREQDIKYDDGVRYTILGYFTSFCSIGVPNVVTDLSPELQPIVEVLVEGSRQAKSDVRFPGFGWEYTDFGLKPHFQGSDPDAGGPSHSADQDDKAAANATTSAGKTLQVRGRRSRAGLPAVNRLLEGLEDVPENDEKSLLAELPLGTRTKPGPSSQPLSEERQGALAPEEGAALQPATENKVVLYDSRESSAQNTPLTVTLDSPVVAGLSIVLYYPMDDDALALQESVHSSLEGILDPFSYEIEHATSASSVIYIYILRHHDDCSIKRLMEAISRVSPGCDPTVTISNGREAWAAQRQNQGGLWTVSRIPDAPFIDFVFYYDSVEIQKEHDKCGFLVAHGFNLLSHTDLKLKWRAKGLGARPHDVELIHEETVEEAGVYHLIEEPESVAMLLPEHCGDVIYLECWLGLRSIGGKVAVNPSEWKALATEGGVLTPPGSSVHTSSDPPLPLQEAAVTLGSDPDAGGPSQSADQDDTAADGLCIRSWDFERLQSWPPECTPVGCTLADKKLKLVSRHGQIAFEISLDRPLSDRTLVVEFTLPNIAPGKLFEASFKAEEEDIHESLVLGNRHWSFVRLEASPDGASRETSLKLSTSFETGAAKRHTMCLVVNVGNGHVSCLRDRVQLKDPIGVAQLASVQAGNDMQIILRNCGRESVVVQKVQLWASATLPGATVVDSQRPADQPRVQPASQAIH